MENISLILYTKGFFGSVLKSPTQMGSLSINNSVTNISRLGTFNRSLFRLLGTKATISLPNLIPKDPSPLLFPYLIPEESSHLTLSISYSWGSQPLILFISHPALLAFPYFFLGKSGPLLLSLFLPRGIQHLILFISHPSGSQPLIISVSCLLWIQQPILSLFLPWMKEIRDKTWGRGGLPTLPGLHLSTIQPSRRGFFWVHTCVWRERKPEAEFFNF